jgi:hypothetical protein
MLLAAQRSGDDSLAARRLGWMDMDRFVPGHLSVHLHGTGTFLYHPAP